jgi:tetratricopeptide (TPR) repeat protein
MIDHDQLANFLDDALAPGPHGEVERELTNDQEALQFVIQQRKLDRTLRSLLGPVAHKQRLKQSILSAVAGATSEELRAQILADTSGRAGVPTEGPASPLGLQSNGSSQSEQRFNLRRNLQAWLREKLQALQLLAHARFVAAAATVIAVGLGILFYAVSQKPAPPIEVGQIASVVGRPTIRHSGQARGIKAQRSSVVCLGDRIATGDADRAEIRFHDSTTVNLNFNTTLEIPKDPLHQPINSALARPAEIHLLAGQVWSKVTKSTNGARFVITTPVASASVKGTEFGLKLNKVPIATNSVQPLTSGLQTPKLVAVLTVKEGAVEFSNSYGNVEATAFTESTATPESAPSQPVHLKSLKVFGVTAKRDLVLLGDATGFDLYNSAVRLVYPLGWSGLELRMPAKGQNPLNSSTGHPRIVRVWPGSPAAIAGLAVGDLVTEANGRAVTNLRDVVAATFRQPNMPVALTILRGGAAKSVSVITTVDPYALPVPNLPSALATELFDATWLLIEEGGGDQITTAEWTGLEQKFERVVDRFSNAAAALNNLAVCYEANNKIGAAIDCFKQAIQLEPGNARFHHNLGRVLVSIGNFERGAEETEAALRLAPDWIPAGRDLARAYNILDRLPEALAAIEQALRTHPLSAELWTVKGIILASAHRLDEAAAASSKAVELESSYARFYRNLGALEWARRNNGAAEAADRKVIELDSEWPSAHRDLALTIISGLGGALSEDPMAAPPQQFEIGRWINRDPGEIARLAEAERLILREIELTPDSASAYELLGRLYLERGQPEKATTMFHKASELDPTIDQVAGQDNKLAWHYACWGIRLDEAVALARKAAQAMPSKGEYVETLALAHFRRGEFDQAELALKRCIELGEPEEAVNWFHLGRVYEQANQLEAASTAYEKALGLKPDYPDSTRALQRLRR